MTRARSITVRRLDETGAPIGPPVRFDDAGSLLALTASAPVPEPSDEQTEAYDAGRAAYAAGAPSTTCPHDPRSELGTLWLRGYVLARRDDQYGPVR